LTDLELIVRTRSSTRISRPDRLSRSTIPPSESGTPTPEVPELGTPAWFRDGVDLPDMAPGHTLAEAAAEPPPTAFAS